ncbi:MAG: hypothetical protein Q8R56_04225 [Polaromonas sp.]|nr:hypothetical protein [Polaromonas sp.]
MECHTGRAVVRIHALQLINQQGTRGNEHRSVKTGSNFSLDQLHAVLQGQLEAFTEKLLGMTLHDDKDGYAHQQGNGYQNYSSDQTNPVLMILLMQHVVFFRILSRSVRILVFEARLFLDVGECRKEKAYFHLTR